MTRRGLVVLPATALALILVATLAGRAATFQTKAPCALLVDYNTGAVLFGKKADAPVASASTTKILTAEIVFREIAEGRLRLSDRMTISPKAASKNPRMPVGQAIAYFGSYSVDESAMMLAYRIERCTFPCWDGSNACRKSSPCPTTN